MVADTEEMEEMDASELHARRLNTEEVLTPQRSGNFIFPAADGTVNIFGREQRLRTSTLKPGSSGTRRRTRNSSRKFRRMVYSHPIFNKTQRGMMRKRKMISGPITGDFIYRHLVEPRVKLYMPREDTLPIPL